MCPLGGYPLQNLLVGPGLWIKGQGMLQGLQGTGTVTGYIAGPSEEKIVASRRLEFHGLIRQVTGFDLFGFCPKVELGKFPITVSLRWGHGDGRAKGLFGLRELTESR